MKFKYTVSLTGGERAEGTVTARTVKEAEEKVTAYLHNVEMRATVGKPAIYHPHVGD